MPTNAGKLSGLNASGVRAFPLLSAGSVGVIVGAFGGHPRGIRTQEWPRCAVCGAAMCHMGQIDSGPWIDLGGYKRLTLFICHATGGRCEDWESRSGANRAVLQKERDENLSDGPNTVRVYRRVPLTLGEPVDEVESVSGAQMAGSASTVGEVLRVDKLGGRPFWLGADATLHSEHGPMRLALQMTTSIVAFDITAGGMAYVFVDPHDPGVARMLWQST